MEASKILSAALIHRLFLSAQNISAQRAHERLARPQKSQALQHSLWLLEQIPEFVATSRADKAMRWLCFVQGVLWVLGYVTIQELRELMKPDTAHDSTES